MNGQKQKSKWQQLKELWANRRSRSFVLFGIYFIFISVLVIAVRTAPNTDPVSTKKPLPSESPIISFSSMNNYEYEIEIQVETQTYQIKGERYEEKELIHNLSENTNYLWENDQFYQVVDQTILASSDKLFDFHILKLQPIELSKLIEKSSFLYKKEYQNGLLINTYEISIKDFYNWYDGTFSDSLEKIQITTEETNSKMTKVILDFTNWNHSIMNILYFSHNQLTGLKTNYQVIED